MNNDAISRKAVLQIICGACENRMNESGCNAPCMEYREITELPAVDAAPQRCMNKEMNSENGYCIIIYSANNP